MRKTWTFGIICTLFIIALVIYNVQLQRKIAFQQARTDLTSLLSSVEMDLKRAFFSLDQLFLGLGNYLDSYALQDTVDPPQTRRVIDDLILKNNYLTALVVIDSDGQVLHWNNNYQKPNLSQREYFRAHATAQLNGLYIGLPQESLVSKDQWIFGISKALRDQDGSLRLVLAAIVDLKYFYRQYRDLIIQAGDSLSLSSAEGIIYSHIPNHDQHVGKRIEGLAWESTADQYTESTIGNQRHLTVQRKLENYPLIITINKPLSSILSNWQKNAWGFTLISILACSALLFLTYRTVSHQKKEVEITTKLQQQAITDPLTKLANRRYILEEAQREIEKAQRNNLPLALIMLDLDHFKKVNDDHGHQAGDEILVDVAERLKRTCRKSDTISRFGGEEFLLLCPATDLEGAIASAEKIREALAEKDFATVSGDLPMTASLGVTQWGNDENDINSALRRADKALYQVKKSGRNAVKSLPSNLRDEKQSHSFWINQRLE